MNHDYAHCSDFTERCPKDCFRAQLERDLKARAAELSGMPISYSSLKGMYGFCPKTSWKMTDEEALFWLTEKAFNDNPTRFEVAKGIAIEALRERAERKTGKWITHKDEHQCSICGEVVIAEVYNGEWGSNGIYDYCPYCGNKLEVEE